MFKCCYEPQASIKPVNDCHQMTFLTTRSTARILIRYLCHRRGLPLRCPAVLLGEGRPDTRERQKSNLGYPLSLKLLRLISLLCHHLKAINNILMPTLSQYVNLVYLIRSYDSLYCVTRKSQLNIALELQLLIQSSCTIYIETYCTNIFLAVTTVLQQ